MKKQVLSSVDSLVTYPRTALLYLACDDYDSTLIEKLCQQDYPLLDFFVLDDSLSEGLAESITHLSVSVLRRKDRTGYKAGNLNHWLYKYGKDYKYFVVADADSILPKHFVNSMVKFAEHPANRNVAIFESLITNWNTESRFANLQNLLRPMSHKTSLSLENRLEQTLSVGHNNLYRTDCLLAAGGFTDEYVAEDYATTLKIMSRGLGPCKTVPLESYERSPSNLHEYATRQARWALQTFQLASINISMLSWPLRFRIIRTLYTYAAPIVWLPSLGLFCFFALQWMLKLDGANSIPGSVTGFSSFHLFWLTYPLVPSILGFCYGLSAGVSPSNYVRGSLFSGCLFFTTLWPVFLTVIRGLIEKTVRFERTGRREKAGLWTLINMSGPSWILIFFSLILVVLLPSYVYINLLWIVPALLAPIMAYRLQS